MVFRVNTIRPVLLAKTQIVVQGNRPATDIETRLCGDTPIEATPPLIKRIPFRLPIIPHDLITPLILLELKTLYLRIGVATQAISDVWAKRKMKPCLIPNLPIVAHHDWQLQIIAMVM